METPSPRRRLIAPRPRPLSLWHFTNPGNWNPTSLRQAVDQGSQSLLDTVVSAAFALRRTRRSERYLRSILADAEQAIDVYDELGWLAHPEAAHAPVTAPRRRDVRITPRTGRRAGYEELTFPSSYVAHPDDPSSARWMGLQANRTVHAWMLRHPEPRPWIVHVHGAGMGTPSTDFTLFRSREYFERGLNVLHPVLPLHGPRQVEKSHYPSESVMHNLHGTLQGVNDVRRALAWIRQTQPGQPIGIHGISLGGFTSGLVASLEADLQCAVLGVPPVDLVLLLEAHHGTGRGNDLRNQNFEAGSRFSPMLTPLKLQPAIPRERRFIYAGIVDQLVDYADHVAPMIAHWDYPEVLVFDGGHVGVGLARSVPGFVEHAMTSSGLLTP